MKKILFVALFTIGITAGIGMICKGIGNIETRAQRYQHTEPANVYENDNDLFVFVMAQPTMPYDSLGVVTSTSYWFLLLRTKAVSPQATGLIFYDAHLTKATAIRFK